MRLFRVSMNPNAIIPSRYSQPLPHRGVFIPSSEQQAFSWRLNIGRICEDGGPSSDMVWAVEHFETSSLSLSKSRQRVSSRPKVHHASSLTVSVMNGMILVLCKARKSKHSRRNQRELSKNVASCVPCRAQPFRLGGIWGRNDPPVPTVQGYDLRQRSTSRTRL